MWKGKRTLKVVILGNLMWTIPFDGCENYSGRELQHSLGSYWKSTIRHTPAKMDSFASNPFSRGMYVGYFNGSLGYADTLCCQHTKMRWTEHVTEEMREAFQKWADELHIKEVRRGNSKQDVRIFPAPGMHYMCGGQNCLFNLASETELVRQLQNSNVGFCQSKSPGGASDFQSHHVLCIREKCNINVGDGLVCNYGISYDTNS